MKKKLIVFFVIIAALIAIIGAFFLIKHIRGKKQMAIEYSYARQTFAFDLSESFGIGHRETDKQYLDYSAVRRPGYLYAWLLLYKHDTGNVLTMEEVKEYLSKEYEDDGSLRLSKNHPKIQGYIDFICYSAGYDETGKTITPEETSTFFYPYGRLKRFNQGLDDSRIALPYPYNIEYSKESKDYVWFGDFPDEIVDQAVDWVFESGWMDLKTDEEYDEWCVKYRGWHKFVIPKSLMGEKTVNDYLVEFKDETTTVLSATGKQVPIKEVYRDIYANEDGTVTFFFAGEQFENYKSILRNNASLNSVIKQGNSSIKKTEFTDEKLTGIVIYADGNAEDSIKDSTATAMGLYQIVNGVDPNEWHVNVVVKDNTTGKIISEDDYPKSR